MNTPDQKKKIAAYMAALRREKRTPPTRFYPKFIPGMTTGDYIRRYRGMNPQAEQQGLIFRDYDPDTLAREAAFYDPVTPLCLEEVNP